VNHRVSEAQKIIWRVRRLGVFIKQKDLIDDGLRKEMIAKLPTDEVVRKDVELLLEGFDLAVKQVRELRRRLIELAREGVDDRGVPSYSRRGLGTCGYVPGVHRHAVPLQEQRKAVEIYGHRLGTPPEWRWTGTVADAQAVQQTLKKRDPWRKPGRRWCRRTMCLPTNMKGG
jgi:hypothetical protein